MADAGSRPPEPPAPHWPHDWHEYEDYKNAHVRHIEALERAGTVLRDETAFYEQRDGRALLAVNLRGRFACAYAVTIEVDKWLDVRRRPDGRFEVRGEFYTYHAWRSVASTVRYLVRYDSSATEDLHVHLFDADGQELEKRVVDRGQLPNLDQFIEFAVGLARLHSG